MMPIVSEGIGGSQAAAAMGISRWKSQMELWLEKTGRKPKEEIPENLAHFGNVIEDVIAKEFTERTGKRVKKDSKLYRCEKKPFMIGYIDRRVIGEGTFLECKNTSEWAAHEFKDGSIPIEYWVQCQHYMVVMNVKYCYLATLIGGNHFEYFEIQRNELFCQKMVEMEERFWQAVLNDEPPEAKTFEDMKLFVKHYYEPTDTTIELEGIDQLIEEIREYEYQLKDIKRAIEERKLQIKEMMAEATIGITDRYRILWKLQQRETFDTKRFKQEYPDLYAKYLKKTESRVFRITERKEE